MPHQRSLNEVIARYGNGPRSAPDRAPRRRLPLPDFSRIDGRHLLLAASCALIASAFVPVAAHAADVPSGKAAGGVYHSAMADLVQLDGFRANLEDNFGNLEFKLRFVLSGSDYKKAYALSDSAQHKRQSGDMGGARDDILQATEIILAGVDGHATPADIARFWPRASGDAARVSDYKKLSPHLSEVIRLAAVLPAEPAPKPVSKTRGGYN